MLRDLVSFFSEIYEIPFSSFNSLGHTTTLRNKGVYGGNKNNACKAHISLSKKAACQNEMQFTYSYIEQRDKSPPT